MIGQTVQRKVYTLDKQDEYRIEHNLNTNDYTIHVHDDKGKTHFLMEIVQDLNWVEFRLGCYTKNGWVTYDDYDKLTVLLFY